MSLARFVLRTATVKALRGHTFAGDIVRDSEIGPIDDAAEGAERPFVIVYTDDSEDTGAGTDLMASDGKTCLVIEIGVTTRMRAQDGDVEWTIPTTDAGMEFTVDAIERQIRLLLATASDPWADLWRTLVNAIEGGKSQRGAQSRDGVRFAGRQVVLDVNLLREPPPGRAPSGAWARFLTLAAADADLAPMLPTLTALITGGATDWQEWRRVMGSNGLSLERARALQITPPAPAEGTSPTLQAPTVDPVTAVPPIYTPTLVE